MDEFDALHCLLKGVTLIESSAGTGKTQNICMIYMRFLVEENLSPDQILVLTFTKATCSELKHRIKNYLTHVLNILENWGGHALADISDQDMSLVDYFEEVFRNITLNNNINSTEDFVSQNNFQSYIQTVLHQIRDALIQFDQAAIYTIHGFCQKLLIDGDLDQNKSDKYHIVDNDLQLRRSLAAKFWFETIDPVLKHSEEFSFWILHNQIGPNDLAELLLISLKQSSHIFVADPLYDGGDIVNSSEHLSSLFAACEKTYEKLSLLWKDFMAAYSLLLDKDKKILQAKIYRQDIVNQTFNAWNDYIQNNVHWINTTALNKKGVKAHLLSYNFILSKTLKGQIAPKHPIFLVIDEILELLNRVDFIFFHQLLKFCNFWLEIAPKKLMDFKNSISILTFDDLLVKIKLALATNPDLCALLKRKFPATFIDEFQDTNIEQYEIIKYIYALDVENKHDNFDAHHSQKIRDFSLFLVGDPKQSIYAFRGADIYSYFFAKECADYVFTLSTNWRANPLLTIANNHLFSMNLNVFMHPQLKFYSVWHRENAFNVYRNEKFNSILDKKFVNKKDLNQDLLHIWLLPFDNVYDEDAPSNSTKPLLLNRQKAIHTAAVAVANEVVRLINDSVERKTYPSEIAILVRTNRQGHLMNHLLKHRGINALSVFKESIFLTEEAKNIEILLQAVNSPHDLKYVKAALLNEWIKIDVDGLKSHDKGILLMYVELFHKLRDICDQDGFVSMWFAMLKMFSVSQVINHSQSADRRIANVIHIGELLFQAAHQFYLARDILEKLLDWMQCQKRKSQIEDKDRLRIEQSGDCVRILTIHQAKGLEFPIVFCPFLFDISPDKNIIPTAEKKKYFPRLFEFRFDNKIYQCLSLSRNDAYQKIINSDDYKLNHNSNNQYLEKDHLDSEEDYLVRAENIRLIYVAMTRAKRRCYLVAGIFSNGLHFSMNMACNSSLNSLLYTDQNAIMRAEEIISRWRSLASCAIKISDLCCSDLDLVMSKKNINQDNYFSPLRLSQTSISRHIKPSWYINSFTQLVKSRRLVDHLSGSNAWLNVQNFEFRMDETTTVSQTSLTSISPKAYFSVASLPTGVVTGIFLHQLYEKIFSVPKSAWFTVLTKILRDFEYKWRALAQSISEKKAWQSLTIAGWQKKWHCVLLEHLTILGNYNFQCNVEDTKIKDDDVSKVVCLSNLPLTSLVSEFPFTLYFRDTKDSVISDQKNFVRMRLLNQLLQEFSYPLSQTQSFINIMSGVNGGFIKGVIDLIFYANEHYYLIDWKTNQIFLNENEKKCEKEYETLSSIMKAKDYWLQGLLYSLATHRYLKTVSMNYDYEKHFSGIYFIFVRGFFYESSITHDDIETVSKESKHRYAIGCEQDNFSKYIVTHRPPFVLIDALDKLFSM